MVKPIPDGQEGLIPHLVCSMSEDHDGPLDSGVANDGDAMLDDSTSPEW